MTTGFVIEPRAQWRSCGPISITSAFSLSRSTVARRTVQTLIGSYVAFSTSTRPPDQRPEPSAVDPCRRRSASDTDPAGAGGTAVAIAGRSVDGGSGAQADAGKEPSTRTDSQWPRKPATAAATSGFEAAPSRSQKNM